MMSLACCCGVGLSLLADYQSTDVACDGFVKSKMWCKFLIWINQLQRVKMGWSRICSDHSWNPKMPFADSSLTTTALVNLHHCDWNLKRNIVIHYCSCRDKNKTLNTCWRHCNHKKVGESFNAPFFSWHHSCLDGVHAILIIGLSILMYLYKFNVEETSHEWDNKKSCRSHTLWESM